MKKLRTLQGGYPRQMDYLLTLQTELITMADSLFAKLGVDMVLKGCEITNNGNGTVNIAAGIVYASGEVLRFDGDNNVTADNTKTFVKDAPTNTDPKVFADGNPKDVYSEVKLIIGNKTSATEIPIGIVDLYSLKNYIQDVVASYGQKGEFKDIYDTDGTFPDNFDASGLGITARWNGWAMVNGNNGTPNGGGRTRITVGKFTDPVTGVETNFANGDLVGEVVHKLIVNELPPHAHTMGAQVTIDAAVTVGSSGSGNRVTPNYTNRNTADTGGGAAHNNMQPSLAVYTVMKIV